MYITPHGWIRIKQFPLRRDEAEATMTGTTSTVLVTLDNIRIPMDRSIMLVASCRKSAGAATQGAVGVRLNAVDVCVVPQGGKDSAVVLWGSSDTDRAEEGLGWGLWGPRDRSTYLNSGLGLYTSFQTTGTARGVSRNNTWLCENAAQPQAIITSIALTAAANAAGVTVGIGSVELWISGPTSRRIKN